MLNNLIPGIEEELVTGTDRSRVAEVMRRERELLADPKHLHDHVIGSPAEFAWDFEVLDRGFLAIAGAYLDIPTGIGPFYLALLRDLGADSELNEYGVLILEFMHLATRINDRFNFHDELAKEQPDLRTAESLVQLRYTAQFLNNYPRYTIIENRFEASEEARVALHRWGTNVFTTVGMSRAALTRWCHRGLARVSLDAWRQNAINTMCEYVTSPVSVAMILAKVDVDTSVRVRQAFSWLSLALKLRCERRMINGAFGDHPSEVEAALLPVTFPGFLVIDAGQSVSDAVEAGGRFPPIRRVRDDVLGLARKMATDVSLDGDSARRIDRLKSEELRAAERFQHEMNDVGVLAETTSRIGALLDRGED